MPRLRRPARAAAPTLLPLLLLLSACGGGGDAGSSSPSQVGSAAPAALAPQTAVPAPTYAASSGQQTLFDAVNTLRGALGVGLLAQDPVLDTAAQAHAGYLSANQVMSHDETPGNPGFYEATPLSRARKAGAPAAEWVAEVAAANGGGADDPANAGGCFDQWLATVYHLQALVTNVQTIGIGYSPKGNWPVAVCVLALGTSTGVPDGPLDNSTPYGGGQQIGTGLVVTVPRDGETGVAPGFNASGESPDPAPDLPTPGRPLMVYVNGQDADILTVSGFRLTDVGGNVVPARILVSSAASAGSTAAATVDPSGDLRRNVAFLLPLAPLAAGTTYTASFSGARAGTAVGKTWSFTTR